MSDVRLRLALLWHQHQPLYRDLAQVEPRGSIRKPWVRLHALRDYYGMAALVAEHPGMRATINLTPVLLAQIDDYLDRGATDRALDLTLRRAEDLSGDEREEVLSSFFEADWHHQIFVHARYRELLEMRAAGAHFEARDLRDLQMWFNLAWFACEFRRGRVELQTGEVVDVVRFVEQGHDFGDADVRAMVDEQWKVLRGIVPLHRALQERGIIEVTTTPLCHPILPLLLDTNRATIDRPGTSHPRRFQRPDDARAQVELAVVDYERRFGVAPRGVWPAEAAVSEEVIPLLASCGFAWMLADEGVLARSGEYGYRVDDPAVVSTPYRALAGSSSIAVFFRAAGPSNEIGFDLHRAVDPEAAARAFVDRCVARYGGTPGSEPPLLTIVLDGENAWGSYHDDGRPFLRALYAAITGRADLEAVTFSHHLAERAQSIPALDRLYPGSWIDEPGSAAGADLGTWIGEPEENRAWDLLGLVRAELDCASPTPEAMRSIYAAEGSDWFWWFGDDQESGTDQEFDDLFRMHLANAMTLSRRIPPTAVRQHIVPRSAVWSFTRPIDELSPGDLLVVRTNCPGTLTWWLDGAEQSRRLVAAGGAAAGVRRYELSVGSLDRSSHIDFRFSCDHDGCPASGLCCRGGVHRVRALLP